ncbi:unnamed protein product, partial [Nesidiocoris tenuis]
MNYELSVPVKSVPLFFDLASVRNDRQQNGLPIGLRHALLRLLPEGSAPQEGVHGPRWAYCHERASPGQYQGYTLSKVTVLEK